MSSQNYNIYKNIMSSSPLIDEKYLVRILHIAESEKIKQIKILKVKESNTALVIKASILIQGIDNEYTKKLFIKTAKLNKSDNTYHDMSMREGKFYKTLHDFKKINLPIPECYDVFVSEETEEFVVVLEDISENYKVANKTNLLDKDIWFSCAECLAKFHSAFWNYDKIGTDELSVMSDEELESNTNSNRECLNLFLKEFHNKFDDKTIQIFKHALEINNKLIKESTYRAIAGNNITIVNGDSHIYNFMLPLDKSNKPILTDFQFWGEGYGVGDLSHLTRVDFPDEFKKDMQIPLVKHYYKTLLEHGVLGYSWKNCINDYRMQIAAMVLIPLWQYSAFHMKYDEWIGSVKGLIMNYEYLKCDELYVDGFGKW